MADPLSVAASIAGLISLTSELARTCYSCYQFYRGAKDAPKSLQQVIEIGLHSSKGSSDLEDVYRKETEHLPSLENMMEEIARCRVKIEDFGQKLAPGSQDFRKLAVGLKWPVALGYSTSYSCQASISRSQRRRKISERL
jgi:hypothetical protein